MQKSASIQPRTSPTKTIPDTLIPTPPPPLKPALATLAAGCAGGCTARCGWSLHTPCRLTASELRVEKLPANGRLVLLNNQAQAQIQRVIDCDQTCPSSFRDNKVSPCARERLFTGRTIIQLSPNVFRLSERSGQSHQNTKWNNVYSVQEENIREEDLEKAVSREF